MMKGLIFGLMLVGGLMGNTLAAQTVPNYAAYEWIRQQLFNDTIFTVLHGNSSQWDSAYKVVQGGVFYENGVINPATVNNKRSDQASIVKLNDGRYAALYSRFGNEGDDTDSSSVYVSFSDNGINWYGQRQLIAPIAIGAYIPSTFKLNNGNILVVFFVRETASPNTSTVRQVIFNSDLTAIVDPIKSIIAGGYHPIASDRLFYDNENGNLLMPYPLLMEGSAASPISRYTSRIMVSPDSGATWVDGGVEVAGYLNENGFGGAIEPGLYLDEGNLVMYYRTLNGFIGTTAINHTSGTSYAIGSTSRLNLNVQNAQSAVMFSPTLRVYLAAFTESQTNPVDNNERRYISLYVSIDGDKWSKVRTVGYATAANRVNNVNLYEDTTAKKFIVTYSESIGITNYTLKSVSIPYDFIVETNRQPRLLTTNPRSTDNIETSSSIVRLVDGFNDSRFSHISRSEVQIADTVGTGIRTWYDHIMWSKYDNITDTAYMNIDASSLSPQSIVDGVRMKQLNRIRITPFSNGSLSNGAVIEDYNGLLIDPLSVSTVGTIEHGRAIYQAGSNDTNTFMGYLGVGTDLPTSRFEVEGTATADLFRTSTGNSTQWDSAYSQVKNAGYLTLEVDPIFTSSPSAAISGVDITEWDAAYTYSQIGHLALTGGTITGSLGVINGAPQLVLRGNGVGASNVAYIDLTDNNNTVQGRIGFASGGNNEMNIFNLATGARIQMRTGGGLDDLRYVSGGSSYSIFHSGNTNINIMQSGSTGGRPSSPVTGQYYFDTTLSKAIIYNGTAWVNFDGTAL